MLYGEMIAAYDAAWDGTVRRERAWPAREHSNGTA